MKVVKGPLADRIEYAILEIIMGHRDGTHRATWDVWMNSVEKLEPHFRDSDLEAAFERLQKGEIVGLSKDGLQYSGSEGDDEQFFLTGSGFNVTITADGRKYWDGVKEKSTRAPMGFV